MTARHDIELLWFADCPNHVTARTLLREVVAELAPEAAIRDVDATDPEVGDRVRFAGSPTIRVDGRDAQPTSRTRATTRPAAGSTGVAEG